MSHHQQILSIYSDHFKTKPFRGIEIGTMCGDFAKVMLNTFPNLEKIYTIDPWKHVDKAEFEASYPQEKHDINKSLAYKTLKGFGERVVIFPMTSDEAIKLYKKCFVEKVEFIHIDGHHTEEQVRRDVENYLPLIKEGGVLSGHDYRQAIGVTTVIDEKFGKRVNSGLDFTWWVYL